MRNIVHFTDLYVFNKHCLIDSGKDESTGEIYILYMNTVLIRYPIVLNDTL